MNELIYKTETDFQTQRRNLCLPGGKNRDRDSQGVWDGHVHTALYKMNSQHGPTEQHRNDAQHYVTT